LPPDGFRGAGDEHPKSDFASDGEEDSVMASRRVTKVEEVEARDPLANLRRLGENGRGFPWHGSR
jgi:hypothetical protein